MPSKKFYAVKTGHQAPCIVKSWVECSSLVNGFPGAQFKGFTTKKEALAYLGLQTTPDVTVETRALTEAAKPIINSSPSMPLSTKIRPRILKLPPESAVHRSEPLVVYTDGSCLDQGLMSKEKWRAGAGAYVPEWNWQVGLSVPGAQTNNRGELFAIIWILETVSRSELFKKSPFPVEIHTDANYVINNITSNNKANLDLWRRLRAVMKLVKVIWKKELAHSGVQGNEIADRLAKQAAEIGDF